jgi:hypothetical protein
MNPPRLPWVMAFALAMVTPSERWVHVGGSANAYQDYLDRESIQRNGHIVTLWTRRDFLTQQRTAWNEIEVDCTNKRDTILAFVQDDAGTVSHNIARPHRESIAIPPHSAGERIFDLVCR